MFCAGSVPLGPERAEQLVVGAASGLLSGATSLDDPCVRAARDVLALAPPGSKVRAD